MINPDLIIKEVTLENIKDTLREWYDYKKYHYVTVNGIDNGESLTIDWIFSEYNTKNKIYVFRAEGISYDAKVPSIMDIVESSWISEWDLADMFDIDVENSVRNMFLEKEAPQGPLRKENYSGK